MSAYFCSQGSDFKRFIAGKTQGLRFKAINNSLILKQLDKIICKNLVGKKKDRHQYNKQQQKDPTLAIRVNATELEEPK